MITPAFDQAYHRIPSPGEDVRGVVLVDRARLIAALVERYLPGDDAFVVRVANALDVVPRAGMPARFSGCLSAAIFGPGGPPIEFLPAHGPALATTIQSAPDDVFWRWFHVLIRGQHPSTVPSARTTHLERRVIVSAWCLSHPEFAFEDSYSLIPTRFRTQ